MTNALHSDHYPCIWGEILRFWQPSLANVLVLSKIMLFLLMNVTCSEKLTNSAYCSAHLWVIKNIIFLFLYKYNPLRGSRQHSVNLKQIISFICTNGFVAISLLSRKNPNSRYQPLAFLKMDYMAWCFNSCFFAHCFRMVTSESKWQILHVYTGRQMWRVTKCTDVN